MHLPVKVAARTVPAIGNAADDSNAPIRCDCYISCRKPHLMQRLVTSTSSYCLLSCTDAVWYCYMDYTWYMSIAGMMLHWCILSTYNIKKYARSRCNQKRRYNAYRGACFASGRSPSWTRLWHTCVFHTPTLHRPSCPQCSTLGLLTLHDTHRGCVES